MFPRLSSFDVSSSDCYPQGQAEAQAPSRAAEVAQAALAAATPENEGARHALSRILKPDDFVMSGVYAFRNDAKNHIQAYAKENPSKYDDLVEDDSWDAFGSSCCNFSARSLIRYFKTRNMIGPKPETTWLSPRLYDYEKQRLETKRKLRGLEISRRLLKDESVCNEQEQVVETTTLEAQIFEEDVLYHSSSICDRPGIYHINISDKNHPMQWGHEFVFINFVRRVFIVHSSTHTKLKITDNKAVVQIDQEILQKMLKGDAPTCENLFGVRDRTIGVNQIFHYEILLPQVRFISNGKEESKE